MPPDAWIVLAVLVLTFGALMGRFAAPAVVMVGSVVLLVVTGVVRPQLAFVGFASPATITIAGLFVLARTIRDHLGLDRLLADFLPGDGDRGRHEIRPVLLRLLPPVAMASAFVNNTPIVATLAPVLRGWAERRGIASSRVLIPLSFATILGGTLTTIGTSTNLVVSGALGAAGLTPLGFFTMTAVAAPIALVGLGVVVLLAPRVLPDRGSPSLPLLAATVRAPEIAAGGSSAHEAWRVPDTSHHAGGDDADLAEAAAPARSRYLGLTLATGATMVLLAATGVVPVVTAVLLACGVLIATRAISLAQAVDALHLDVLLIVACAIGLGASVESSGLAASIGRVLASTAGSRGSLFGLALIVVGTLVLTELITNVAAAALILPIAIDVADRVGGDPRGFAVAVAVAASASFLTPIGYQTNTIVYGLGRYRFGDYWRLGLPLALTVVTMCLLVVPKVWP